MQHKNFIIIIMLTISSSLFAQTIDYSLVPYRQGSKWGFADAQKNVVITPKYNDVNWFSEGLAAVQVGTKWGYINKQGKLVIPAKFTVAKSFRKGYVPNANKAGGDSILFAGASLLATGYESCINEKGVVLTKCPAINENAVIENRVPIQSVSIEKTYSLPNNSGLFDKVVDDYKIAGNNETFYIAQKNNLYGVFNSKFETIVPFEFNSIKRIQSNGNQYLQVSKAALNGIINGDGAQDIVPEYTSLVLVNGNNNMDYVIVKKDGKTYVKDITNKDIVASGFTDITYDTNGGFILTDGSNMKGVFLMDNTSIMPKYADVRIINRNSKYLQIKTSTGKVGYINTSGDEFFVE